MIYVTHDQVEALSMADRMVVLKDGRAQQIGPPEKIYRHPKSRFVAEFLGEANFLPATLGSKQNGLHSVQTVAGTLTSSSATMEEHGQCQEGQEVICCIRPESLQPIKRSAASTLEAPGNVIEGRRTDTMYLGEAAQHTVALADGCALKVLELNPSLPRGQGEDSTKEETECLYIHPDDVILVPVST